MMKILFFELEEWQKARCNSMLENHELVFFDEPVTAENILTNADAEAIGVFVYSKLTSEILEKMQNLKLIVTLSTGFDHIDLDYCNEHGITVCNVPTYGEKTVAEHTFALILAITKKLYQSIRRTKSHHIFATDDTLRTIDLNNKRLGLVGCGNIGKNVARIARGFEMDVLVYDIYPNEELARNIGFRYASFDEIMGCDIVSVHVPYNKHTHYIINKDAISKMKPGSFLINTARGGLIDTHALVNALKDGRIAGAALDVLEEEASIKEELELLTSQYQGEHNLKTVVENHVLMKMDNCIVTPHNAFNSKEALDRIINTSIENIITFLEGKPKNVVKIH